MLYISVLFSFGYSGFTPSFWSPVYRPLNHWPHDPFGVIQSLSHLLSLQSSHPCSAFPKTLAGNLLLTYTILVYMMLLRIVSPLPHDLPYTLPVFLFAPYLFCTDPTSKVSCNSVVMKSGVRVLVRDHRTSQYVTSPSSACFFIPYITRLQNKDGVFAGSCDNELQCAGHLWLWESRFGSENHTHTHTHTHTQTHAQPTIYIRICKNHV
jgi:hypothetical protein